MRRASPHPSLRGKGTQRSKEPQVISPQEERGQQREVQLGTAAGCQLCALILGYSHYSLLGAVPSVKGPATGVFSLRAPRFDGAFLATPPKDGSPMASSQCWCWGSSFHSSWALQSGICGLGMRVTLLLSAHSHIGLMFLKPWIFWQSSL